VESAAPGDLVIHLISGGASALAALPLVPLVTEPEKSLLHRLLVRSGLGIHEINVVRKHFSAIKGGRLLAHAPRARHLSILLSDVPRDCPETIGGGPTLPDPSTWGECLEILKRSGIQNELPRAMVARIGRRKWPETPKPSDRIFRNHVWTVLGDSMTLVEAARRHARALGYATRVLPGSVEGTAESLLDSFCRAREGWMSPASAPRCLIGGGEVRVRTPSSRGRGGRAQDLAAAAALRMRARGSWLFLAAGSDGRDGNSPAAGALADGGTFARARRLGLNLEELRETGNTYELFHRLGDSLITGPTGNNLRDLYLWLETAAR
jgi:hydroxypyruvate reductase